MAPTWENLLPIVENKLQSLITTTLQFEYASAILQVCVLISILADLPIVRPVLVISYLVFVPGAVVIHILRYDLDLSAFIPCAVALSAFTLILLGIISNAVYILTGIGPPFELLATVAIIMAPTTVLLWYSARTVTKPWPVIVETESIFTSRILLITLFPAVAAIGTSIFLNIFQVVSINIVLICTLALVPLLLAISRLDELTRVVTIWSVSLTLLWSMSLVSTYMWGWDVHIEAFIVRRTLELGWWEVAFQAKPNSMATYAILGPIYTIFTGLPVSDVFKVIYPLLFSVVPVGMYHISKELFDKQFAVVTPFVFMVYYGFFKNIAHKQYIAEIFVILVLIGVFTETLDFNKSKFFVIVGVCGLVVTHYATTVLFVTFLFVIFGSNIFYSYLYYENSRDLQINLALIVFICTSFFMWYLISGGGITMGKILERGLIEIYSLSDRVASPPERSGAGLLSTLPNTIGWRMYLIMSAVLVISICIGVANSLFRHWRILLNLFYETEVNIHRLRALYDIFAASTLLYLLIGIFIPLGLGIDRILQLVLLFVAPYSVIGFNICISYINRLFSHRKGYNISPIIIIALFLGSYLLFSTGVAFLVLPGDLPAHAITITENNENGDWLVYNEEELRAADWLTTANRNHPVITTQSKTTHQPNYVLLLTGYYGWSNYINASKPYGEIFIESNSPVAPITSRDEIPNESHFAYIRTGPVIDQESSSPGLANLPEDYQLRMSRIYHNDEISIYYVEAVNSESN